MEEEIIIDRESVEDSLNIMSKAQSKIKAAKDLVNASYSNLDSRIKGRVSYSGANLSLGSLTTTSQDVVGLSHEYIEQVKETERFLKDEKADLPEEMVDFKDTGEETKSESDVLTDANLAETTDNVTMDTAAARERLAGSGLSETEIEEVLNSDNPSRTYQMIMYQHAGLIESDIEKIINSDDPARAYQEVYREIVGDYFFGETGRMESLLYGNCFNTLYFVRENAISLKTQKEERLAYLESEEVVEQISILIRYKETIDLVLENSEYDEENNIYIYRFNGDSVTFTEEEFTGLKETSTYLGNIIDGIEIEKEQLKQDIAALEKSINDPNKIDFTYRSMDELDAHIGELDSDLTTLVYPAYKSYFYDDMYALAFYMKSKDISYEEASKLKVGYIDKNTGKLYHYQFEVKPDGTVTTTGVGFADFDADDRYLLTFADVYGNDEDLQTFVSCLTETEDGSHIWDNKAYKKNKSVIDNIVYGRTIDSVPDKVSENVNYQDVLNIIKEKEMMVAIKNMIIDEVQNILDNGQYLFQADYAEKSVHLDTYATQAAEITNIYKDSFIVLSIGGSKYSEMDTKEYRGALIYRIVNGDAYIMPDFEGSGVNVVSTYPENYSFTFSGTERVSTFTNYQKWSTVMTVNEKGIFNYICQTEGFEAGYEYINSISHRLDERYVDQQSNQFAKFALQNEYTIGLTNFLSILLTPVEAASNFITNNSRKAAGGDLYLTNLFSIGDVWHSADRQALAGITKKNFGDFWSGIIMRSYDVLYSMDQSAVAIMMTKGLGGSFLGGIFSNGIVMGMPVFNSTMYDAKERKLSDTQAYLLAGAKALTETLMESWSTMHWLGFEKISSQAISSGLISSNIASKIAKLPPKMQSFAEGFFVRTYCILTQGVVGGNEEFDTEVLDNIWEYIIAGNVSPAYIKYENYKKINAINFSDEDDATLDAMAWIFVMSEISNQAYDAGLTGFLAEGFMGGVSNVSSNPSVDMYEAVDNKNNQVNFNEAFNVDNIIGQGIKISQLTSEQFSVLQNSGEIEESKPFGEDGFMVKLKDKNGRSKYLFITINDNLNLNGLHQGDVAEQNNLIEPIEVTDELTEPSNTDKLSRRGPDSNVMQMSYKGFNFVYKTGDNVDAVIDQIVVDSTNGKVSGKILLELNNTKGLTQENLSKLPDNVEVRILGDYGLENFQSFKSNDSAIHTLENVTYTVSDLKQIMGIILEFENGIDPSWDNTQKARYAYEFMQQIKYRDMETMEEGRHGNADRASHYDGLMNLIVGRSTCQGFTHTYCELLRRMDIPCTEISGKLKGAKGTHAFALVEIDGQMFIIDPTRNKFSDFYREQLAAEARGEIVLDDETRERYFDKINENDEKYPDTGFKVADPSQYIFLSYKDLRNTITILSGLEGENHSKNLDIPVDNSESNESSNPDLSTSEHQGAVTFFEELQSLFSLKKDGKIDSDSIKEFLFNDNQENPLKTFFYQKIPEFFIRGVPVFNRLFDFCIDQNGMSDEAKEDLILSDIANGNMSNIQLFESLFPYIQKISAYLVPRMRALTNLLADADHYLWKKNQVITDSLQEDFAKYQDIYDIIIRYNGQLLFDKVLYDVKTLEHFLEDNQLDLLFKDESMLDPEKIRFAIKIMNYYSLCQNGEIFSNIDMKEYESQRNERNEYQDKLNELNASLDEINSRLETDLSAEVREMLLNNKSELIKQINHFEELFTMIDNIITEKEEYMEFRDNYIRAFSDIVLDKVTNILKKNIPAEYDLETKQQMSTIIDNLFRNIFSEEALKTNKGLPWIILQDNLEEFNNNMTFDEYIQKFYNAVSTLMELPSIVVEAEKLENPDLYSLLSLIRQHLQLIPTDSDHGEVFNQYRQNNLYFDASLFFNRTPDYSKVPQQMEMLNAEYLELIEEDNLDEYIKKVGELWYKFMLIHPYGDGNGRTGRLLLNLLLARKNMTIPALFTSKENMQDFNNALDMFVVLRSYYKEDYQALGNKFYEMVKDKIIYLGDFNLEQINNENNTSSDNLANIEEAMPLESSDDNITFQDFLDFIKKVAKKSILAPLSIMTGMFGKTIENAEVPNDGSKILDNIDLDEQIGKMRDNGIPDDIIAKYRQSLTVAEKILSDPNLILYNQSLSQEEVVELMGRDFGDGGEEINDLLAKGNTYEDIINILQSEGRLTDEVVRFFNETISGKIIKVLTKEELSAIQDYSMFSSEEVNDSLHTGETDGIIQELIDNMKSAIRKNGPTTRPMLLYRGVSSFALFKNNEVLSVLFKDVSIRKMSTHDICELLKNTIGFSVDESGFSSTSPGYETSFASREEYPIVLEIIAPVGTEGMYINQIAPYAYNDENEFTIDTDQTFRILNVYEGSDGKAHVMMIIENSDTSSNVKVPESIDQKTDITIDNIEDYADTIADIKTRLKQKMEGNTFAAGGYDSLQNIISSYSEKPIQALMSVINDDMELRRSIVAAATYEIQTVLNEMFGIDDDAFVKSVVDDLLGGDAFIQGKISDGINWDNYINKMYDYFVRRFQTNYNNGSEPIFWSGFADEYHHELNSKYITIENVTLGEVSFLDLVFPWDQKNMVKLSDLWSDLSSTYTKIVVNGIDNNGNSSNSVKYLFPSTKKMSDSFGKLFREVEFFGILDSKTINTLLMCKTDVSTMDVVETVEIDISDIKKYYEQEKSVVGADDAGLRIQVFDMLIHKVNEVTVK